jgi:hypothetical protein
MVFGVLKEKVIIVLACYFLFLSRCFRFAGVPPATITHPHCTPWFQNPGFSARADFSSRHMPAYISTRLS